MDRRGTRLLFTIFLTCAGVGCGAAGSTDLDPPDAEARILEQPMDGGRDAGPRPGDAAACVLPSCLRDVAVLASSCPATGACTQQIDGNEVRVCYANGVELTATPSGPGMVSVEASRPDGSVCFGVELDKPANGPTTIIYRDPAGGTVARFTAKGSTLVVSCPGQVPVTIGDECRSQMSGMPSAQLPSSPSSSSMCTPGICPQ